MRLPRTILAFLATLLLFAAVPMSVSAQDSNSSDEAADETMSEDGDADENRFAQGDPEEGKDAYTRVGLCVQCHGWDGNGFGKNPRSPGRAALLRESQLEAEDLYYVIACGIPGTPMPYHDRQAYRDDRCFGLTLDDFGEGEAPSRGKTMREEQIIDLIAYLEDHIIGAGETTLAQCEEFYGRADHPGCRGLD